MESNYSEQIKKVSTINGAYIGCMWLASFVCMANTVSSPILSLLGLGIGIGSLFAIVIMAYQFYWKICNGALQFTRSWLLVLLIILYASILMAFGVYIYMQFFDNGNFGLYYDQMLKEPTTKAMMDQIFAESGLTSEDFVAQITSLSPIRLALNILESNLFLGFLISLPLTLLSRIKLKSSTNKVNQ